MKYAHRFAIAGFLLTIIIVTHLFLGNIISLSWLQEQAHNLYFYTQLHFTFSLITFALIFIGSTIVGLPITALLTIAAGYLFGFFYGLLIVQMSAIVGTLILFFMVRYLIGQFIQKKYQKYLFSLNYELEQFGPYYVLMLQILPITPSFFINICAGVTNIPWWSYCWATALGILPGSIIYILAGKQLHTISSTGDLVSPSFIFLLFLLVLLALFTLLVKKRLQNKF